MIQLTRDARLYLERLRTRILSRCPPMSYSIELPKQSRLELAEEHARRCLLHSKTFSNISIQNEFQLNLLLDERISHVKNNKSD